MGILLTVHASKGTYVAATKKTKQEVKLSGDLAKAVENTVRATVRSELAQSRKRPDAS